MIEKGNKKKAVIAKVFEICRERGTDIFDNDLVREVCKEIGFGNPFDATAFHNSAKLPDILKANDVFILHLGKGRHCFARGIDVGYHSFEDIPETRCFDWKYRKSVLNESDTSEANVLAVAANQRVIHDFLYEDIVAAPKIYFSRRTNATFDLGVGRERYSVSDVQMEVDLTFEYQGLVTIFEAKNGFPEDFAVYQLYNPFRYYYIMREAGDVAVEAVSCCYVLRERTDGASVLRLYEYEFEAPENLGSLSLKKAAEYRLLER